MEFFGESSVLVIFGILLSGGCFVLHLIGFATPYWYKVGYLHQGLWQVCGSTVCATLSSALLSDQYKAAQAMECLAFIAFLAVIGCIVLKLFAMKDQTALYIIIALGLFAAGGFSILGVIIFGTLDGLDTSKFHFSFAFCILASLGSFLAAVLIFAGRSRP